MATIGPSGVRARPVAAGKTKVATIFDIFLLVVVGVVVGVGGTVAQNPIRVYRRILIFCMGSLLTKI